MITFKPFKAVLPVKNMAKEVAALPYDVYNRSESIQEVMRNTTSFLKIDRAEVNFDNSTDSYADSVYIKANQLLQSWIDQKILVQEDENVYYLYELSTSSHVQTGIVGLTAVQDLLSGSIKDHEKTRTDKLNDRIKHIDTCNAHTGPILMFYQDKANFGEVIETLKARLTVLFDFVSDDHIRHRIYKVDRSNDQLMIQYHFNQLDYLYIADGHHRASAAKTIALNRNHQDVSNLSLSSNLFLSVVFPHHQLKIFDYNRVLKDLNGLSPTKFLECVQANFTILAHSKQIIQPKLKGQFSMNLEHTWYLLDYKYRSLHINSPIEKLDCSILQNTILDPILAIKDPMSDSRIDFVGGIKGLSALEVRLNQDCVLAFALVPTTLQELIEIADLGQLMPPKSTWFEPKLRSGLFIHLIND